MFVESAAQGKINQVLKSLRLIRLIRIIKLYKYFLKSQNKKNKDSDHNKRKNKSRKVEPAQDGKEPAVAEEIESLFRQETDPSKLGKSLSDTNTREVIIGVLLMLMVLPLLAPTEIDYS